MSVVEVNTCLLLNPVYGTIYRVVLRLILYWKDENVRIMVKRHANIFSFAAGFFAVFCGYIAWGFYTISYRNELYRRIGVFLSVLTMVFYAGMVMLNVLQNRRNICKQLGCISSFGFILFLLVTVSNIKRLIAQGCYLDVTVEGLWILTFLACSILLLYKEHFWIRRSDVRNGLYEHRWLILLLTVTALLMIEPNAMQFKWDGVLYYLTCNNLDIGSLSSLAAYGHIAQTYGGVNAIVGLITGNTAIAMIMVNCIAMLLSVCAFYGVLKLIFSGAKEWVYTLFTAVYAWSPFLLGMVYYHNLDFLCQCLYPIVLYFLYKEKWLYFCIASFLFCFTKEPAIIIYGSTCIGVVAVDWMRDKDYTCCERMIRSFVRKKYYLMVLPGILWLVTYKMLGPWSAGEGGVSVDLNYIFDKLKVLYIFNFNWIFSIMIIGGFISLIVRHRKNSFIFIVPILCGQISFTIFSCIFKTANHPRYNDTNQVAIYIIAMMLLYYMFQRKSMFAGALIAGLMLLSTYCTIDPVTLRFFPKYNIGKSVMITTMKDEVPLGDGMIYNRQMLGLEKVFNMALKDTLENSDVVLLPTLDRNAYFFDGMAEVGKIEEGYRIDREYWDILYKRRVALRKEGTQEFRVFQLTDDHEWEVMENEVNGSVNFFYLPIVGQQYADEIRNRYTILDEQKYEYRGWQLNRICFELD